MCKTGALFSGRRVGLARLVSPASSTEVVVESMALPAPSQRVLIFPATADIPAAVSKPLETVEKRLLAKGLEA